MVFTSALRASTGGAAAPNAAQIKVSLSHRAVPRAASCNNIACRSPARGPGVAHNQNKLGERDRPNASGHH